MCLKIIQKCLPKAFDPESFLQNTLLGKVLIKTVEKAKSLYTCSFSDLSGGLVTVTSAVTSVVPPHTPATPLTPMMSPCPATLNQAVRPGEAQTITVTLPVTPLATADGIADQRRHWWHIEEVNSV